MLLVRRIIVQTTSPCLCRSFAKFAKKSPDPGIQRRKKLLSLHENEEITDFDELESDFMQVHKSHKEHYQELESQKERLKYLIVKQKYFKEKFPNFLTWHDKEQIRYLHRTNPEEWTTERLSEGFPALPEVIQKIVKGNWTKTTQIKITNHDASVQKNWKSFKDGERTNLPNDLVEHLNKFTNRALNLKPFELPNPQKTVVMKDKNIGTEFSDIITSYKKLKKLPQNENTEISSNAVVNRPPQNDTYLATPSNGRNSVTLNQLQVSLTKQAELGKKVDEEEKNIIKSYKQEEGTAVEKLQDPIDLTPKKYQTSTGLQCAEKTEKDLSHLNYPEKISIPKAIFKKGFIYKLNDCYYDDDGEFLYRVPGMGQ